MKIKFGVSTFFSVSQAKFYLSSSFSAEIKISRKIQETAQFKKLYWCWLFVNSFPKYSEAQQNYVGLREKIKLKLHKTIKCEIGDVQFYVKDNGYLKSSHVHATCKKIYFSLT